MKRMIRPLTAICTFVLAHRSQYRPATLRRPSPPDRTLESKPGRVVNTINRYFISICTLLTAFAASAQVHAPAEERVYPGVWSFTFGRPEAITPLSTRGIPPDTHGLERMSAPEDCPVRPTAEITSRGVVIRIPLKADEMIYGLGLQMGSFQQRGSKKLLRVNADPEMNSGDSHAPVPFYVTTDGYGVYIDNARYMTFYLGNRKKVPDAPRHEIVAKESEDGWNALNGPYERLGLGEESEVIVEIPHVEGTRVVVFGGPGMKEAISRYNLYSGGGALPPRWGLGFWYRVHSDYTQEQMLALAEEFRERDIPCDVLGLEPHWQTHSYSSSYVWSGRFPDPAAMLAELRGHDFRVNMWQQAFVHPKSPIYTPLLPWSGDYEVWDGLVPDFITPEARAIFGEHQLREVVEAGISGFKADECDNSDFTGFWSFPELSRFPSGADGEQMHCLFGLRYQDAVMDIFNGRRQRTYGLVRNSGALAAPYPFVLYSDLYDHRTFVNTVAQSGFSGLLWTPEVRHATSRDDLIRRLQAVVLSPLAMINGWYLQSPPWKQLDRALNNRGVFDPDWDQTETICREIIGLRMQLVPYIHAAFVEYQRLGIPPFRALVVDYTDDPQVRDLNGQYMIGERLMAAPIVSGELSKRIYFPAGVWYDLFTGERYEGGQWVAFDDLEIDRIPLFVKENTILPLAQISASTEDVASRRISAKVFGPRPADQTIYADDGSFGPDLTPVTLHWNERYGRVEMSPGSFYTLANTLRP